MSTQTARYKPLLFSEKLAPNSAGQYTLCRAASLAMGYDAVTNGDWTTNPDGSRWGRVKIKNMLERMRSATGEPLRDGYNQTHVPAFLKAMGAPPDAWEQANVAWTGLIGDLNSGFVVELAGNVRHTPDNSPLRKYVNPVDHDIIMLDYKSGRISFIDPMTPHGARRYIRWAPASDFQQFGSEFRTNGNYIAGRLKRGKYSDLAILRRKGAGVDQAKRINELEQDLSLSHQEVLALQGDLDEIQGYLESALGVML